jgi:hypothetical protein
LPQAACIYSRLVSSSSCSASCDSALAKSRKFK